MPFATVYLLELCPSSWYAGASLCRQAHKSLWLNFQEICKQININLVA